MPTENEMLLVDFGPLNAKTKLYAFKWDEIKAILQKVCIPMRFEYFDLNKFCFFFFFRILWKL